MEPSGPMGRGRPAPDLPDRPGPAYLLVAIRAHPTLRHYDPELVEYWVTDEARRGVRETLTFASRMPRRRPTAMGPRGQVT